MGVAAMDMSVAVGVAAMRSGLCKPSLCLFPR